MAKSSYAATHSGECQLCGHTQKLPGGGRLSLHGYTKQWGFFSGVCSGARGLPYETHTDLIADEVVRQKAEVVRLTEWRDEVVANEGGHLWVHEYIPAQGRMPSGYEWRKLTPEQFTVKTTKYKGMSDSITITYMTAERNNGRKPKLETLQNYSSDNAAAQIAKAAAARAAAINTLIEQRKSYIAWLKARLAKWTLRDLTPLAAEDIGVKATTLHAVGAYWSKREGRDIALCVSSIRAAGYKLTTKDNAKVTCKACLKTLAAQDAAEVIDTKAKALVAEMITMFGAGVMNTYTATQDLAVKEIRYKRKDIDKEVRAAAIHILERGVRS